MSDNERALVNRGDDPYPNDIKAEAVALVYESGNFSQAAREMAVRYPERHPSRQLITRWFKQVDPDGAIALSTERKEAFESGIIELADKARQRMFDALDDIHF
jgi:transposase-like protein